MWNVQSGEVKREAIGQSRHCVQRQSAVDWDSFDVGSMFTASRPSKPAPIDLTSELMRSQSRQEKLDVGLRTDSRMAARPAVNLPSSTAGVTAARHGVFDDNEDDDSVL